MGGLLSCVKKTKDDNSSYHTSQDSSPPSYLNQASSSWHGAFKRRVYRTRKSNQQNARSSNPPYDEHRIAEISEDEVTNHINTSEEHFQPGIPDRAVYQDSDHINVFKEYKVSHDSSVSEESLQLSLLARSEDSVSHHISVPEECLHLSLPEKSEDKVSNHITVPEESLELSLLEWSANQVSDDISASKESLQLSLPERSETKVSNHISTSKEFLPLLLRERSKNIVSNHINASEEIPQSGLPTDKILTVRKKKKPKKKKKKKKLNENTLSDGKHTTQLSHTTGSVYEFNTNLPRTKFRKNVVTFNSNWEPMPRHDEIKFVNLKQNHPEYITIMKLFLKTTRQNLIEIISIHRIQNPYLMGMFMLNKMKMMLETGKVPEETLLFHGTTSSNIDSICLNNFDWRRHGSAKGNKFGQGISLSPSSYYSSFSCKKDKDQKVMIVARVLIGNKCNGDENMSFPPYLRKCSPLRFDTSQKPDGQVIVKYTDDEFYPAYKITFKITNVNVYYHSRYFK